FESDSSAVGVPHRAAGWFGSKHSNGVLPEDSLRGEGARSPRPGGFFIGHKDQAYSTVQMKAALLQGFGGERHRRQTALHVGRTAPEQVVALNAQFGLGRTLRRNNIVMTAEIECAI